MNNDQYLNSLNRYLRQVEADVSTRLRFLMVRSIVRIRDLILRDLPDEGLSRQIIYQQIRLQFEAALAELNDTFRETLLDSLQEMQLEVLALAHLRLEGGDAELFGREDLLRLVKVFGGWSLLEYFRRRSPSRFMAEIIRLVDAKVQRGIMEGLPTEEIARQIVPEVAKRSRKPQLTIRKGTVLNAIRNRLDATIAQAVWQLATNSERMTWDDATVERWVWNAVLDERTCPICTPLDGLEEMNRDDFPYSPPVHPNCRCRILPLD